MKNSANKREVLERLYKKYNRFELIEPDPLQFVYRYSKPRDMEVAAFLSAALAYGRVAQIEKSLNNLLNRLGKHPFEFVVNFNDSKRDILTDFKHRFTSGEDIADLLELLRKVISEHGSIESFFALGYNQSDENIIPALSRFCSRILGEYGKGYSKGLSYLLCQPENGSACKRLNLFLRWMVRSDEVDTGLWKSIAPAKLIVPIDVHMGRLCRILGFYDSKTVSLSAAIKITKAFAEIQVNDPVKYDFALSRVGIVKSCNGKYRPQCEECELLEFCEF